MTTLRVSMFHTLPTEARTSSEVYAVELGKALRAAGIDVLDVWPPSESSGPRLGYGLAAARRYSDRYIRYQVRATRSGSQVNHIPDHGYGHLAFSLDPQRTVITFLDAMLLKLRAHDFLNQRVPWVTLAGHLVGLRAIRRVARVITPSSSSRNDFLRFQDYPPERVVTIPLAVSPAFRPLTRRNDDPTNDNQSILHVGHCGFYKNIESILRVLPLVQRRLGRPVRLRKVGGPFTSEQMDLIASLGISDSIDHLGFLPDAELAQAYADADVLLMPSLHEGFGLPVLEAMASGTAVIASNRGSLPEVVGDAGMLVEPDDIDAIAEAVALVLSDGLVRGKLVGRGLARAREFTWERTARATLDVYRAVCDEAA